jgi:hypothetical protein
MEESIAVAPGTGRSSVLAVISTQSGTLQRRPSGCDDEERLEPAERSAPLGEFCGTGDRRFDSGVVGAVTGVETSGCGFLADRPQDPF